jgi:hypothetical protein
MRLVRSADGDNAIDAIGMSLGESEGDHPAV